MKDIKNAFLAKQRSKTEREGRRMRRVCALFGVKPLLYKEITASEWEPLVFDPFISKKSNYRLSHARQQVLLNYVTRDEKGPTGVKVSSGPVVRCCLPRKTHIKCQ